MRKLTVNRFHLLDNIDSSNSFLDELGSLGCITWQQREHIIKFVHLRDRNEKLVDFLTRRSVADFHKFITVLDKEQPHLANVLVTDRGEISYAFVRVHCETVGHTFLSNCQQSLSQDIPIADLPDINSWD